VKIRKREREKERKRAREQNGISDMKSLRATEGRNDKERLKANWRIWDQERDHAHAFDFEGTTHTHTGTPTHLYALHSHALPSNLQSRT